MNPRISADPNVCGGDACIAGTRIPVHVILSHLAGGDTVETVLKEFPRIESFSTRMSLCVWPALCERTAMTSSP